MNEQVILKDQAAHDAAAKVADYEHGWSADIETDFAPKGLNEDTVRFISGKKNEPEWMLDGAAEGVPALADHAHARLGQAQHSADRLSGRLLLRRAQGQAQAGQP